MRPNDHEEMKRIFYKAYRRKWNSETDYKLLECLPTFK